MCYKPYSPESPRRGEVGPVCRLLLTSWGVRLCRDSHTDGVGLTAVVSKHCQLWSFPRQEHTHTHTHTHARTHARTFSTPTFAQCNKQMRSFNLYVNLVSLFVYIYRCILAKRYKHKQQNHDENHSTNRARSDWHLRCHKTHENYWTSMGGSVKPNIRN